jgi:hypothetical protein
MLPHAFGEQSGSLVTDTEAPGVHDGAVQDKTIRKRCFLDMVGPSRLSLLLLVSRLECLFTRIVCRASDDVAARDRLAPCGCLAGAVLNFRT